VPDIVGGKTKLNTIVSTKDDDDSAGIPEAPAAFFNPGQGFIDQGGLGEFGLPGPNRIAQVAQRNREEGERIIANRKKAQEILKKQSAGLAAIGSGGGGQDSGKDDSPTTGGGGFGAADFGPGDDKYGAL